MEKFDDSNSNLQFNSMTLSYSYCILSQIAMKKVSILYYIVMLLIIQIALYLFIWNYQLYLYLYYYYYYYYVNFCIREIYI